MLTSFKLHLSLDYRVNSQMKEPGQLREMTELR